MNELLLTLNVELIKDLGFIKDQFFDVINQLLTYQFYKPITTFIVCFILLLILPIGFIIYFKKLLKGTNYDFVIIHFFALIFLLLLSMPLMFDIMLYLKL